MIKYISILILLSACNSTKSVTLDGSKSYDEDGKIVRYQWSTTDGQIYHPFDSITGAKIKKGASVELLVTDDKGATGKDSKIMR